MEKEVSHDVRIWALRRNRGKRTSTYSVRWKVGPREFHETFATAKLADAYRAGLISATNERRGFDPETGQPIGDEPTQAITWLRFAMEYAAVKWPTVSAQHRRGIAEALSDVTVATLLKRRGRPHEAVLRNYLRQHAFNRAERQDPEIEEQLDIRRWLEAASPDLHSLEDPTQLRSVLTALSTKRDGTSAAPSTVARKRATLNNAFEYAVETGRFSSNPLGRVKFRLPKSLDTVDRRVVVNPNQARQLLAVAWVKAPALTALFGCLYFAGLRPSEARNLRRSDLTLPEQGWGEVLLTGTHQITGRAWTDSGEAGEERGLKHRNRRDTRRVPLHPELVLILRRHLETFECGADNRLFVSRTGRAGVPIAAPYLNPVPMGALYRAWKITRDAALTAAQVDSPLAKRPYDLRHACLSTWLNAGVPAAQVAEWAGHGVEVLLRVYAKCLDGEETVALRRIEAMVGLDDSITESVRPRHAEHEISP